MFATHITSRFHTIFQVSSAWFLYKCLHLLGFLTITTENIPDIQRSKRYIFIANHQSYLDVYAIFMGLDTGIIYRSCPLRFLTASSIYFSLLLPIIWLGGGFPARRRRQGYHAVDYAIRRLDIGERIVIFPEGKRCSPGTTPPHTGVQRIMDGATAPYTPILVHLDWSRSSWWHRTLRVTYHMYDGPHDPQTIMDTIYSL